MPIQFAPFCFAAKLAAVAFLALAAAAAEDYDIVILNGRVMDPESNVDAVRNVGITGGTIRAISSEALRGKRAIDAKGLVVAPGFIDLHSHGQDAENYRLKARDGVTTALELEVGTADVDRWYAAREGKALIHHGVAAGHIPVRMKVMHDGGTFLPSGDAAHKAATDAEIEEFQGLLELGLKRGALAVGFGINYTEAASRWEILQMFRVAARFGAPCHVHIRHVGLKEPANSIQAVEEVIAASAITGAPLHIVHISSMGLRATPRLLQMIAAAQAHGMDVTTECYPYTATCTRIESALYDDGWQQVWDMDYKDLEWVATGERLTAESFSRYRNEGGSVIGHAIPPEVALAAVASPLTMIASDGVLQHGKGHPRSSGSYARVLGKYVREEKALKLMDALRKMTLMPALRLEKRAPMMRNKGRIRVGADADLTLFDPERVIDKATYAEPAKPSEGIPFVLVDGAFVVKDGKLEEGVAPGLPVRAPVN